MRRRETYIPVLALGFATASCGGGGSSSSAPQEPPRSNGSGNGGNPPPPPPPPLNLPTDIPLAIYENHPTNKAVYDATPQGQSSAQIELPADTADNNLFTLSDDGRIWFKTAPDDEAKTDSDGDGVYIVRLNHPHNEQGFTEIAVTVSDVAIELTPQQWQAQTHELDYFEFTYEQVKDILPDNDFVPYILHSFPLAMPQRGPLIITWSLVTTASDLAYHNSIFPTQAPSPNSQSQIETFRATIIRAFQEFEAVINIKFVEVADTASNVGDIRFFIVPNTTEAAAPAFAITPMQVRLEDISDYSTHVHEIGHLLGLKHPFHTTSSFPANEDFERGAGSERSIMSYNEDWDTEGLQPADIAALQFLYGAPGTDFDGLQARLMEEGITPEIL